ncbi:putative copper resistance protein [Gordonia araii NBRC 100433]|uniref:Putative copper resistance protein n=1 Tax=Gordonia araii NBRC 100433 TaxID=1073574 RepID=G7H395_9ACTN|nr:copper resistance CopC family protein [Gordonia araii]NNG96438.1 copper resistance protein CopC [Gordonia araii NBRC 100433]GAB10320.1 putative copper resistance protein [Gordonia araii NBRC 100433]
MAKGSRSIGGLLLVVALVFAGSMLGSGLASAHSRVVSSNPADGAGVDRSPANVEITFNEPLQPDFAAASVVGPDQHFWHAGDPIVDGKVLRIPLRPLGPAGVYQVNFRVTSADGHPVSGQRTFRLTVASDGTPGAPVAEASGGTPVWPFLVGAGVVLVAAVGAVAWFTRGGAGGRTRRG